MFRPEVLISSLNSYGVHFLVGGNGEEVSAPLHPRELLAGLSMQADARMRLALILPNDQRPTFKLYYTAACFLQAKYHEQLEELLGHVQTIPNFFSEQLNLALDDSVEENLQKLALRHTKITDLDVNWYGTYQHAAKRVITRLRSERKWSKA